MKNYVEERYFTLGPKQLAVDFLRPVYALLPRRLRRFVRGRSKRRSSEAEPPFKAVLAGREPLTVFDVGAFTGEFSLAVQHCFPEAHIHCFEPFPAAFAQLEILMRYRGNCLFSNCALSDRQATRILREYGYPKANSFLSLRDEVETKDAVERSSTEVETTTFDRYCDDRRIDRVDMLHIDVNGTEADVLQGALAAISARSIHCISIVHRFDSPYFDSSPFAAINQVLHANGYHLRDMADIKRKGGRITKAHVIFGKNGAM